MDKNLIITAHHEAGHAIAAMAFGLQIIEASILPTEERKTLGHVQMRRTIVHAQLLQSGDQKASIAEGVISMAGIAGDYLHGSDIGDEERELLGHWGDQDNARQHLGKIGLNDQRYVEVCIMLALSVVRDRLPQFSELARLLLDRKKLDGRELAAINASVEAIDEDFWRLAQASIERTRAELP